MSISGSVGLNGLNRNQDVRLIQQLLNKAGVNAGQVDGMAGPKTKDAILRFQRSFLSSPDGRVDPNGQTIRRLNALPGGNVAPPVPAPKPGGGQGPKYRTQIEAAAKAEGVPPTVLTEFLAYWEQSQFPVLKPFLSSLDTAENGIKVAQFFFFLRKFGFSLADTSRVLVLVAGLRAPEAIGFINGVLRNGARVSSALKAAGGVRTALGLFVAAIETYNFMAKGEYSQATATVYKSLIGLAVPWAAGLDAIQSLFPEVDAKSSTAFKVLRACDPIGLGGIGVDSLVTMVQSIIDFAMGRDFNEQRLAQLVKRMKSGPTALFAELGENAGDALYEISQMDSQDWALVGRYTWDELGAFFRGAGK